MAEEDIPPNQRTRSDSFNIPKGALGLDAPGLSQDEFLDGLPREGDTPIIGPVKLQAKISKGGMGVVYRGHHVKLDIDVAVKFLSPFLAANNPEYVLRFEREARIAAQINNENLVRVFDIDSVRNYHYVVMEFVCGETARERVVRKGPLAVTESLEIIRGATRGLEAAHQREVVHRDIKPDNILIDSSGIVKLADLGIAKIIHEHGRPEEEITQSGVIMGTPSYMPPEQFYDSRSVSSAGDIYSMGATLFYLLTGKPPYTGSLTDIIRAVEKSDFPDIRKERSGLPHDVLALLARCTQRDLSHRPPNATALLQDLNRICPTKVSLSDHATGTVRTEAKVSTPPAKKIGEIRFAISDRSSRPTAAQPSGAPSPGGASRWRMAAAIASTIVFLGICVGVGSFLAFRTGADRDTAANRGTGPAAPAPKELPKEPSKALEIAMAPTAPAVEQATAKPAMPAMPAPEAKVPPPVDAAEVARKMEQAAAENKRKEEAESRRKEEEEVQHLQETRKRAEGEARSARMALFGKDLDRARASLADGSLAEAEKILAGLQAEPIPDPELAEKFRSARKELTRAKIQAALAAKPALEAEAISLLQTLRDGPDSLKQDSPFALALADILTYAGSSCASIGDPPAWKGRLAFLAGLSAPPEELPGLIQAHRELVLGVVRALAGKVGDSIRSEEPVSARAALEILLGFGKDPKLPAALAQGVAGILEPLEKEIAALEARERQWQLLAECREKGAAVNTLLSAPPELATRCIKDLQDFIGRNGDSRLSGEARKILGNCTTALWARDLAGPAQMEAAQAKSMDVAREIRLGDGPAARFLLVPPGKHRGTEIREFYLAVHEVTRGFYDRIVPRAPSGAAAAPEAGEKPEAQPESDPPVTGISWEEAGRFTRELTKALAAKGVQARFRLPTELEWEYACAAGASEPSESQDPDRSAWYWINSGHKVHPVGTREKSPWGFFDLLGNAAEMCEVPDAKGPGTGPAPAAKGGSFNDSIHKLKPAARRLLDPKSRDEATGLRLVLEP